MSSRFVLPLADVGDGITPSDGAKLTFFLTGTSTLKDTFADEAATTPNTNPVIADGDGVFPEIWITGRYKVRLTDKNDVQKWEEDPIIEGVNFSAASIGFETIASMVANEALVVGQFVTVEDYATGNNSGVLFFKVVAAGTGTADGGSFIDLTGSSLQAKQNFPDEITAKMFGVVGDGDGGTDDTIAFNNQRTYCRASSRKIFIREDTDIRVTSQLVQFDNEVWQLDGNIIRDWTTAATDKLDKATIRNEHALASSTYIIDPGPFVPVSRNTGIEILGNGEIKNSAAVISAINPVGGPYAGPHLLFHASDEMDFGHITLRGPCAEWASMIWGNNVHYDNLKIRDQAAVFEDGVHIVAGVGHTGTIDAQSGDDALAIINNFNQGISAVSMTVLAESESGNALTIGLTREGSTAAFGAVTEKIEDVYVNAVGTAGNASNSLVLVKGDVPNANYDRVDGVVLDLNLKRGDGAHDLSSPFCIFMTGGKNIKMRGNVEGAPHQAIFADDITNVDFDLDVGMPQIAGFDTVVINDGTDVAIGGTVEAPSNRTGIELNATSAVVTAKVSGIQSGQSGVTVDTGSDLRFSGKLDGVSGNRGITALDTASEIYIGNEADVSGVERIIQQTAVPAIYRAGYAKGLKRGFTIATAAVSIFGATEGDILCEGGVSDTLSTINNGMKGQIFTVRNGEAVPGTVTLSVDTADNIVLSASPYLIDDADKALELKFDGTNWQEIARY